MSTGNKFLKDVEHLLARLAENEDRLERAEQTFSERIQDLKKRRREALQIHVLKLLPDLNKRTVKNLGITVSAFATPVINKEIEDARNVGVTFFTWITGNAQEYRDEVLKKTTDSLRVQLASIIDAMNPKPEWCTNLQDIDDTVLEVETKLKKLHTEKENIELKMRKLEEAKKIYKSGDKSRISGKTAREIARLAKNDRERKGAPQLNPRTGRDRQDYYRDDDDFCDILLPIIIFTTLFSDSGHAHDHGVIENGNSVEENTVAVNGGELSAGTDGGDSTDNVDRGDLS